MNDWDDTPWAGTAVAVAPERVASSGPPPGAATVKASNSAYGPGVGFYNGSSAVLSGFRRSPLRVMREAQALYHSNPWIGVAERTVTRKVAGLPWHLEDEDEVEVDDQTTNQTLLSIRDLLEKPQAALPAKDRQPGLTTRRGLTEITSRHMGLCGVSYWYKDQMNTDGQPLALLYINPARLYPHCTDSGNLLGYSLDPKDEQGRGGLPIRPDEVIPFYLEVPDFGHQPVGLVESAALKAQITRLADQHAAYVLGTGGRIPGIVSPRDGYISDPDQFARLEADFRNVNEAPDAAKRTTILRGPIDFTKTAGDPQELGLLDISRMNRDDTLAIWGVPPSQAGVSGQSVGLNSGETRRYEAQILMEGPVHARVTVLSETVQYDLLDLWAENPQVVIEEPDFDDDSVPYELAAKAAGQPLTNNERRLILKLDPLPDYGPDGEPLGLAIVLPSLLTTWAQGPNDLGKFDRPPGTPDPEPDDPTPPPMPFGGPPAPPLGPPTAPPAAKAGDQRREFLGLRKSVDERHTPAFRSSLQSYLDEQRADIVARVREKGAHLQRKPSEVSAWWRNDHWDRRLATVVRPHVSGIAVTVATRTKDLLAPAKADPFADRVEQEVTTRTGRRIHDINDTTRQAVADAIKTGFDEGQTIGEIAAAIEDLPAFDAARAELIARTETGYAYNAAAVSSYREYGVDRVQVYDGDGDEICAAASGAIWTLEEAGDHPLGHPHCTRDFAPYLGAAA